MKKAFFCLIISAIIILFSSCYREKLVGEYYLTDEMKAQNPFHGFEKLSFTDDTRSTIGLSGADRINEIKKYYIDKNNKEYDLCENDHISFSNQINKLIISMNACFSSNYIHISLTLSGW